MIEYLFLETSGHFMGTSQVTFTKNDRKVVQKKYIPISMNERKTVRTLSEEETDTIFNHIDNIGIPTWQPRYENYEILDGEHWIVRYRETGQRVKTIEGINDYPKSWEKLLGLIEKALPVPLYN